MNKLWKALAKRYRLRLEAAYLDANYGGTIIECLEQQRERLKAQVRDRDNLIRMENENYRRVNEELDALQKHVRLCQECEGSGRKLYHRKDSACLNCSGKGWIRCSTN